MLVRDERRARFFCTSSAVPAGIGRAWDDGSGADDKDAPQTFRQTTKLSQHISFLKDFFRCYKDFDDKHIDVIELMLGKLYEKWGISDRTDFSKLTPEDYPILSDLYELIEAEYKTYDAQKFQLYTAELLQDILLGLHSMILYSTDPSEGFLTKQGITQVKFALARSIFPEQLQELYAADTRQRDALKEIARRLYQELIDRMANGVLKNERIEKLTEQLVERLATHKGKMQYGYLQAPVKAIVDEIVDELARDEDVAEAYRLWIDIRTDILSTYHEPAAV